MNDNHVPVATYLDASVSYNFTNFVNGANSLLYDVDGRVYRVGIRFVY